MQRQVPLSPKATIDGAIDRSRRCRPGPVGGVGETDRAEPPRPSCGPAPRAWVIEVEAAEVIDDLV